ncbi:MAG: pseudouridine synthase [Oscillospiraceae bacterium]
MEERLQKIIAAHGGMSRRAAEKLISDGKVLVNGVTAGLGCKADASTDEISIDGVLLNMDDEKKVYIMLNKPAGFVTTMSDEKGRRTVAELVQDIPQRVYPVGRLDLNSEGLLLMTNDGDFANKIMHPSFEKEKTYRVQISGDIHKGIPVLLAPMELDGIELRKPSVKLLKEENGMAVIDITIHEGKNRQIRRMCEAAGLKVHRLTRISIGKLGLGRLKKGCWRHLTKEELELLCSN